MNYLLGTSAGASFFTYFPVVNPLLHDFGSFFLVNILRSSIKSEKQRRSWSNFGSSGMPFAYSPGDMELINTLRQSTEFQQ